MKRRLVSMCLAVMLVGGLSLTSMLEVKAAENKVIDGSELTHENESIGYDKEGNEITILDILKMPSTDFVETINEKDNVIVAIEPLSKGTKAVYQVNGRSEEVKVLEDIPMYHKIARVPIKAGSEIIKYGEYIGEAACDIPAGSYSAHHQIQNAHFR